jgi:hypothetical protein
VDPAEYVEVVEFNDVEALRTVLERGEVVLVSWTGRQQS